MSNMMQLSQTPENKQIYGISTVGLFITERRHRLAVRAKNISPYFLPTVNSKHLYDMSMLSKSSDFRSVSRPPHIRFPLAIQKGISAFLDLMLCCTVFQPQYQQYQQQPQYQSMPQIQPYVPTGQILAGPPSEGPPTEGGPPAAQGPPMMEPAMAEEKGTVGFLACLARVLLACLSTVANRTNLDFTRISHNFTAWTLCS